MAAMHNQPSAFSEETFDLLAGIAQFPTAHFYQANRAAFKAWVEVPLQGLLLRAGARLPGMVREQMETRRGLFSRFLKNDFGRGGAWASYWGAFYPRGSRRLADVQLALWLNAHRVQVSFYIGEYGVVPRERFARNCARYHTLLPDLLAELVNNPRVLISREGRTLVNEAGEIVPEYPLTWEEWLSDPAAGGFWVRVAMQPKQALSLPAAALEDLVVKMHADYFPLALLAMEESPLPWIEAYLAG
jgi:5-methylcytosine-specific restriction enzyme B